MDPAGKYNYTWIQKYNTIEIHFLRSMSTKKTAKKYSQTNSNGAYYKIDKYRNNKEDKYNNPKENDL